MSEEKNNKAVDTSQIENPNQPQQLQLQIDESKAGITYSSTVQVRGSAEDITLDFAGPIRPTGSNAARLTIEQRVILNPWAAKRLAIAVGQAVEQYEKVYGPLELDPRKRMINPPAAPASGSGKLS